MNTILTQRTLPSLEMIRMDTPGPETMAAVNRFTRRTLAAEDVHVRRAFGIHDAVDTFFSRFKPESIDDVARLAPGGPVTRTHGFEMIGPGPESVATIFNSERVLRPNVEQQTFVKGSGSRNWGAFDFYWLRGHSRAEDLALEIDGGIRREMSLAWRFALPECSVCEKDMRECDHMPGQTYNDAVAFYNVREVRSVRHLAFVDRGGQLGTEIDLLRDAEEKTPKEVIDDFIRAAGMKVTEEDRDGLIEFARCYDSRKLSKKQKSEGWFTRLPVRQSRLSWFTR